MWCVSIYVVFLGIIDDEFGQRIYHFLLPFRLICELIYFWFWMFGETLAWMVEGWSEKKADSLFNLVTKMIVSFKNRIGFFVVLDMSDDVIEYGGVVVVGKK